MSGREFDRLLHRLAREQNDPVVACEVARRAYELLEDHPHAELLGVTLWLALSERARGSSCLDLTAWSARRLAEELTLPDAQSWTRALLATQMTTEEATPVPAALLVLRGDRLYLRRDDVVEAEVAERLAARWSEVEEDVALTNAEGADRAVLAVRRSRLAVITGGPGTGKTTAVRAVIEELHREDPELRVALAAPTGKAAARLAEALGPSPAGAQGPRVQTLHRLLGMRPGRYERDPAQLPYDLVVVDEASMIGLHLMHELLRRLTPSAHLLLVGDSGQLASVEAGSVLADLHAMAREEAVSPSVRGTVVEFSRNWRFDEQPGISALAEAIRSADSEAAVSSLRAGHADLVHHEVEEGMRALVDGAVGAWQRAVDSGDVLRATTVLRETRVLCALREGPVGVGGVTRRIEARLRGRGADVEAKAYLGRPLLVVENAPDLDLANGDVGVLWEVDGRLVAAFQDGGGERREISLAQLPAHVDAWAMTVHKAQGSEFDEVWLVLPPEGHPLATRDLVYTAVTRARRRLHIVGSAESLRLCVDRDQPRLTGLAARLRERLA